MVLIAGAGAEQRHQAVTGCAGLYEMADNEDTIRSSTTSAAATPPPPSVSPVMQRNNSPSLTTGIKTEWEEHVKGEQQGSPRCNGTATASPPWAEEERGGKKSADDCGREQERSHPSPSLDRTVKVEAEEDQAELQQEKDQDGPLDFSLRRRGSVSESFTDDSRTSSSISPPMCNSQGSQPFSSATSRHSPEDSNPRSLPQTLVDLQRHAQLQSARSPASSPDISDPAGQSKSGIKREGRGRGSPVKSSLTALGMMAESTASGAMTPATVAAMLGQNGGMMGSLNTLSAVMSEARKTQGANGGKVQRPFKAYPKEALHMPLGYLGLPGVNPFPGMDQTFLQGLGVRQEDIMAIYKQQREFLKEREKQMNAGKGSSVSPPLVSLTTSSSTSSHGSNSISQPAPSPPSASHPSSTLSTSAASGAASSRASPPSNTSHSPSLSSSPQSGALTSSSSPFPTPTAPLVSSTSSTSGSGNRKRPRTMPDTEKDEAYWERRRKNNDAAKRSRDARRAKEDEIAIRAALLEQENLKLRVEVAALKSETARLRCMLYNT